MYISDLLGHSKICCRLQTNTSHFGRKGELEVDLDEHKMLQLYECVVKITLATKKKSKANGSND